MSHIRYLIRRRDNGQHVGYAPDHVHVWLCDKRAESYIRPEVPWEAFAIEEYTLRPTWIQRFKWFLAWVTG